MIVAGSIFIFPSANGRPAVNPAVAAIATILVAGFLWIAVRKSVEAAHKRPAHDLEGLVGQTGEARTKVREDGSVFVSGEMWSAKSDNAIPAGSPIRVVRREGFILVVEKENPEKISK
jgi:membrane-bound serine protease (ClpP class)